MNLIVKTIIFGIVMTAIDIPWINLVMLILYKNIFNIKLNVVAGALAYLCMIAAYPFVISKFDTLKEQLTIGAILGFISFGTYGFTLAAIYNKYPLRNAFAETAWGMTLYTLTTLATYYIIKFFDA